MIIENLRKRQAQQQEFQERVMVDGFDLTEEGKNTMVAMLVSFQNDDSLNPLGENNGPINWFAQKVRFELIAKQLIHRARSKYQKAPTQAATPITVLTACELVEVPYIVQFDTSQTENLPIIWPKLNLGILAITTNKLFIDGHLTSVLSQLE